MAQLVFVWLPSFSSLHGRDSSRKLHDGQLLKPWCTIQHSELSLQTKSSYQVRSEFKRPTIRDAIIEVKPDNPGE